MTRALPLILLLSSLGSDARAVPWRTRPVLKINHLDSSKPPKVRVYVTDLDSTGAPITDRKAQSYRLVVDGVPLAGAETMQRLSALDETVAITLVYQVSSAMREALTEAVEAGRRVVDAMPPGSMIGLIAYTDVVVKTLKPSKADAAKQALDQLRIYEDALEVNLPDAIRDAMEGLDDRSLPRARMMVIFSDGLTSELNFAIFSELGRRAQEKGILVHSIGYNALEPSKLRTLYELSRRGNGTFRATKDVPSVKDAFVALQNEVRDQLVLSYQASKFFDGKLHEFQIETPGGQEVSNLLSAELARAASPEEQDGGPWYKSGGFWIGLIIAVVVVAQVPILLILLRRRRTRALMSMSYSSWEPEEEEDEEEEEEEGEEAGAAEPATGRREAPAMERPAATGLPLPRVDVPAPSTAPSAASSAAPSAGHPVDAVTLPEPPETGPGLSLPDPDAFLKQAAAPSLPDPDTFLKQAAAPSLPDPDMFLKQAAELSPAQAPAQAPALSTPGASVKPGQYMDRKTQVMAVERLEEQQVVAWIARLDGAGAAPQTMVVREGFLLGSDPGCHMTLEGEGIRPRHGMIQLVGGSYGLTGTDKDGKAATRPLYDGDRFVIGPYEFVFMQASRSQVRAGEPVRLEVLDGMDRGRSLSLEQGVVYTIGSHNSCDLVVRGKKVDARHMLVQRDSRDCIISDLGSEHGLSFRGEAVGYRRLKSGDEVSLGEVRLLYTVEE